MGVKKIYFGLMLTLTTVMLVDTMCHAVYYGKNLNEKNNNYKTKLEDVRPLIYYAGDPICGYNSTHENYPVPLIDYQYYSTKAEYDNVSLHPFIRSIGKETYLFVDALCVDHDEKRGYIWIRWITRHSNKRPTKTEEGRRELWFIEKDNMGWKVVNIESGIDGRRWLWREDDEEEWE